MWCHNNRCQWDDTLSYVIDKKDKLKIKHGKLVGEGHVGGRWG